MFNSFTSDISGLSLPDKFTFPFYYEPHPLAVTAAEELQKHIQEQKEWEHNFGLPENKSIGGIEIGKMFGVLVVQKHDGTLGYLAAFSGKLADGNHHDKFVPPVYDMLQKGDYFDQEGQKIIAINKEIEQIEIDPEFIRLNDQSRLLRHEIGIQREKENESLKANKRRRKAERKELLDNGFDKESSEYLRLHDSHKKESLAQQYHFNQSKLHAAEKINQLDEQLSPIKERLATLKAERKKRSNDLQNKLFSDYTFLNAKGKNKSLLSIFEDTILGRPPAGAGECAAPKLLQYAFLNELKPIALAEFWWGIPPSAEVKKHKHYYPACKGKCFPILSHMLEGMEVDPDPIQVNHGEGKKIEILHEEEHFIVINKPEELLSVPGKEIKDSVYSRIKSLYPKAKGPLIVHRLDMSTSGIMILALSDRAYKSLQQQFIKRTAQKMYVAVLDGDIAEDTGQIELPLCLDFLDRPKQMVDLDKGKQAITAYRVINKKDGKTRISFFPKTGRTHQLRIHAAHKDGLNCPIVGDDLYGTKADRLHLHAQSLTIYHPITKERIHFESPAPF